MKIIIALLFTSIINSVYAQKNMQSDNLLDTLRKNIINEIDTVLFEGVFVFDCINEKHYLIEKRELEKINGDVFSKKFRRKIQNCKKKIYFIQPIDAFEIVKIQNKINCDKSTQSLFSPLTNGLIILREENRVLSISLISASFVKLSISREYLLNYPNLLEEFQEQEYITVYTTMFCR